MYWVQEANFKDSCGSPQCFTAAIWTIDNPMETSHPFCLHAAQTLYCCKLVIVIFKPNMYTPTILAFLRILLLFLYNVTPIVHYRCHHGIQVTNFLWYQCFAGLTIYRRPQYHSVCTKSGTSPTLIHIQEEERGLEPNLMFSYVKLIKWITYSTPMSHESLAMFFAPESMVRTSIFALHKYQLHFKQF